MKTMYAQEISKKRIPNFDIFRGICIFLNTNVDILTLKYQNMRFINIQDINKHII